MPRGARYAIESAASASLVSVARPSSHGSILTGAPRFTVPYALSPLLSATIGFPLAHLRLVPAQLSCEKLIALACIRGCINSSSGNAPRTLPANSRPIRARIPLELMHRITVQTGVIPGYLYSLLTAESKPPALLFALLCARIYESRGEGETFLRYLLELF